MSPFTPLFDPAEIRKTIDLLFDPSDVVELRIMDATYNGRNAGTVSGYFDGSYRQNLIDAAALYSGRAPAVYVTLNPVLPDVLHRSANDVRHFARGTTKDNEILRRKWLLIDLDPKRPSGISSTDAEHQAALDLARQVRDWLTSKGWPLPVFADSGNGAHLLNRIELDNSKWATQLLKHVLEALDAVWTDDRVTIDRKVYNAARITKLYGTLAAKGSSTAERPQRLAKILALPFLNVISAEFCLDGPGQGVQVSHGAADDAPGAVDVQD